MRINFLHLDLGVGGAERLVVDAASSLKLRGHDVLIATSHHDPDEGFDETRPAINGLLAHDIRCKGDWLPRHACRGRFHLFFSVLRMIVVSWYFANKNHPDVIFVDQVSFIVPLLRLLAPEVSVLFYCHFPDKLLAPPSRSLARRLYRLVFDYAEEVTTANADVIVVNSQFTAKVVTAHFPYVARHHSLEVLYPCVDLETFDMKAHQAPPIASLFVSQPKLREVVLGGKFVLSINRFERKKGLALAIEGLARVKDKSTVLVMAGGYDVRVNENVEHLQELKQVTRDLNLQDRVFFLPKCSQDEKQVLLQSCRVLVYTPQNEHFGIVPIEAGATRKPVIACNSGGPLESIVSGETGYLVEPDADSFAKAMEVFLDERLGQKESDKMGLAARRRVEKMFARTTFGESLERVLLDMTKKTRKSDDKSISMFLIVLAFGLIALMMSGFAMVMQAYIQRET